MNFVKSIAKQSGHLVREAAWVGRSMTPKPFDLPRN
jgi:hypothetical protein